MHASIHLDALRSDPSDALESSNGAASRLAAWNGRRMRGDAARSRERTDGRRRNPRKRAGPRPAGCDCCNAAQELRKRGRGSQPAMLAA
jgi:hypothetical protein